MLRIAVAIAIAGVVARTWVAVTTHATSEDFLITLRYAENIAAGRGFVYNPGAHVLGTTTPLYTLILAFSELLRVSPVFVGKLLNIAADGVTCFLVVRIAARPEVGRPVAGLFAALLYAFTVTPIQISIGGMETGLVTCVGMALILACIERKDLVFWALAALLFLLRPDGLVLVAVLAIATVIRDRRLPVRGMLLALAITLPWLLFATWYFGSPIPTSLIAKLTVYTHFPGVRNVVAAAFRTQFLGGAVQIAITALFVVGATRILVRARSIPSDKRPLPDLGLTAPSIWLVIYYGAMRVSPVPPFPWYFLPPWPVYLLVAAIGGAQLVGAFYANVRLRDWAPVLALLGVALLAHMPAVRRDIAVQQATEDTLRIPIGRWLGVNMGPDERVMLEPIGYVGYYSKRRILDLVGLVSPEVFASYRTANPLRDMIARLRPEWLCLRPREARTAGMGTDADLDARYQYVREFHVPGRPPDFLIYHLRQESAGPNAQYRKTNDVKEPVHE